MKGGTFAFLLFPQHLKGVRAVSDALFVLIAMDTCELRGSMTKRRSDFDSN